MAERLSIVALHGSASTGASLWSLGRAFPANRRFTAPDRPGYGRAAPLPSSAVPDVAHDVEAVGAGLGRRPVHLFGQGYGGLVALSLALREPGRVASLTLYEPDAFSLLDRSSAPDDCAEMARLRQASRALGRSIRLGRPADGMAVLADLREGPGAWTRSAPARREGLTAHAERIEMDFAASLTAPLSAEALAQLDVPVMVMMGLESPAFAQRAAELTALSLERAQLVLLPECGSNGPQTDPIAVALRLKRHIAMAERGGPMPFAPLRRAA